MQHGAASSERAEAPLDGGRATRDTRLECLAEGIVTIATVAVGTLVGDVVLVLKFLVMQVRLFLPDGYHH